MLKPIKVNLYAPLGNGGPTTWAKDLVRASILHSYEELQISVYQSLRGYLSQPFRKGICHTNLPFPYKPIGQKYILTIHGNFYEGTDLWAKMYPKAILSANIVTLPSRFLQDELIQEATRKDQNRVVETLNKAVIIPNGVVPVELGMNERLELGINERVDGGTESGVETGMEIRTKRDQNTDDKFTVGLMTNFNFPQKAEGVIKLAKILGKTKQPIKFLIAGDGVLRTKTEQQVEEAIKDCPNLKTEFLGHVKKEVFYAKIDIFAYYSDLDNQPLALMEAMTTSIPVITNNVGAVKEVLTDEALAPYICDTNEQYEKMIIKLLQSKEARKANVQACQESIEPFYWDNIIPQWAKLYTITL